MSSIEIKVMQARGLPKADTFGKIDPYFILICGGDTQKTTTKKNTYTPVYTENFIFTKNLQPSNNDVLIKAMDWDAVGSDDHVGNVRITISGEYVNRKVRKWFTITGLNEKDAGEVELEIIFNKTGGFPPQGPHFQGAPLQGPHFQGAPLQGPQVVQRGLPFPAGGPPAGYPQPVSPSSVSQRAQTYQVPPAQGYPAPPAQGQPAISARSFPAPPAQGSPPVSARGFPPPAQNYPAPPSAGQPPPPGAWQPPPPGTGQPPPPGAWQPPPPNAGQPPPPGAFQPPPQGYGQPPPQGYGQPPPQGYGQPGPQVILVQPAPVILVRTGPLKLYIQQKVFTWGDKFDIRNESGGAIYRVNGEVFTIGKKLHVLDTSNVEVAYIHEKVLTLWAQYEIEIRKPDVMLFTLKREYKIGFGHNFNVLGLNWTLKGDFGAHDYRVFKDNNENQEVFYMHKHWMSWGDSYEMIIHDQSMVLPCVCIALSIDAFLSKDQGNNSDAPRHRHHRHGW